jgi:hypothetical protein
MARMQKSRKKQMRKKMQKRQTQRKQRKGYKRQRGGVSATLATNDTVDGFPLLKNSTVVAGPEGVLSVDAYLDRIQRADIE